MVEDVSDLAGSYFPVVLYDGENEFKMGNLKIDPSMNFKSFQFDISQKIGISPNQITVYLVDRRRPNSYSEPHRKMPITSKSNFAAIAKETECDFLAVLKRTRRNRKAKPRMNKPTVQFADYLPGKLLLLRRNTPEMMNPQFSPFYDQIGHMGFDQRLRNLEIQRNNYANLNLDSFPRIEESCRRKAPVAGRRVCEDCEKNRGYQTTTFHLCVNDPVLENHRRWVHAGPIAPPKKAGKARH